MVKREEIEVEDLAKNAEYPNAKHLCMDDWDTCDIIQDKQIDFDGEKGFTTNEVVVKRKTDDKFFMFTYSDYGKGEDSLMEETAYEVFEKTRIVTYYE